MQFTNKVLDESLDIISWAMESPAPNVHIYSEAEESLALKHYEACRIISNMDISYGLIIEDDCVFTDKFRKQLGIDNLSEY